MRKRRAWFVLCLVLAAVLLLAGCSDNKGAGNATPPSSSQSQAGGGQSSESGKAEAKLPEMTDVKSAPVVKLGDTAEIGGVKVKVELAGAREIVPDLAGSYLLKVTVENGTSVDFEVDPAYAVWVVDEPNLGNPEKWVGVPYPDRCSGRLCLRHFDLDLMLKHGWRSDQVLPYEAGPDLYGTTIDPFPAMVKAGETKAGHVLLETGTLPDQSGKELKDPLYLVFGSLRDQKAWVRFSLGTPQDLFKKLDEIGFTLEELKERLEGQGEAKK